MAFDVLLHKSQLLEMGAPNESRESHAIKKKKKVCFESWWLSHILKSLFSEVRCRTWKHKGKSLSPNMHTSLKTDFLKLFSD